MFRSAGFCFSISMPILLACGSAHATVTIAKGKTENMSCSNGVCVPTASDAVLNASYLGSLLGDYSAVTVTTTGAGVQANDIVVTAPFKWSRRSYGSELTLDAYQSITIGGAIDDKGALSAASVSLITNDGGSGGALSFSAPGSISLTKPSDGLTINGTAYTLVNNVRTLAKDIALNPSGSFALAESIDASGEGTFKGAAISTTFTGTFQGLGNTIYDLAIYGKAWYENVGLFATVGSAGAVENLNLARVSVISRDSGPGIGTIAGENDGTLSGDSADGFVQSLKGPGQVGGLVGYNVGAITTSHSTAYVNEMREGEAGGLVGLQDGNGTIVNSYATGAVQGTATDTGGLIGTEEAGSVAGSFATGNVTGKGNLGGLIGALTTGSVINCYATGVVSSRHGDALGGFVGFDGTNNYIGGSITTSYSTGAIKDTEYRGYAGGFAGSTDTPSGAADAYWDTTTSGKRIGVGNGDSTGITGLTTTQFQSGLPAGFDPSVWAEDANINNGFPYLIANPPPQ